jgi:hypothetical protein
MTIHNPGKGKRKKSTIITLLCKNFSVQRGNQMKTQREILAEEINEALSLWEEKPDDERSIEERVKQEAFIGNSILRWARQGFLKLDEEALNKRFK